MGQSSVVAGKGLRDLGIERYIDTRVQPKTKYQEVSPVTWVLGAEAECAERPDGNRRDDGQTE